MKKVKAEKKVSQPTKSPSKRQQGKKKKQKDENANNDDLPGYPHYRPSEDILNQAARIPAEDLDELTLPSPKADQSNPPPADAINTSEDDLKIVSGTEADVTEEDIRLLGSPELSMDGGDDELLKRRVHPVDMAGKDLDVPGTELDDADEELGEEDEENNPYSIGGDRHEDLEEDNAAL